jgi:N-acetylmuramoyl-L-alanine amidase
MSKELPIVVIDPGHGGSKKVGGSSPNNATGPNGLLEKNLTLDIARRIPALLAKEARVILTRTSDVNVGLKARADVARTNGAAAFLSIHLNGWSDPKVDGTETWVAKDAPRHSRDFAAAVLKRLLPVTKVADRGVREEDFGMILTSRHAAETAVCLAEVAFLTNPAQAKRFEDEDYRQLLAEALAEAVASRLPAPTAAKSFAASGGYGASRVPYAAREPEYADAGGLLYRPSAGLSEGMDAYALDSPPKPEVSEFAVPEWTNLTMVKGDRGEEHLYYLVSGGKNDGRAVFNLKIKNAGEYDFEKPSLKIRLRAKRENDVWTTIPLKDQKEEQFKSITIDDTIKPNASKTIPLFIERETLRAAYNPDYPRMMLEVEFHWRERIRINSGSRFKSFYRRHPLGFFLMDHTEFVNVAGKAAKEVRFNEPKHKEFWIHLHEKEFTAQDRTKVEIESTITTHIGRSKTLEVSSNKTVNEGTTQGRSQNFETKGSLSVGSEDVAQAGLEMTASEGRTWEKSKSSEISKAVSNSRTFEESLEKSLSLKAEIDAAPAGKIKALYAYPVFDMHTVKLLVYGGPNDMGQATSRTVYENVPLLTLKGWGSKQVVSDAKEKKARSQSLAWEEEAEAFNADKPKKRRQQESPAQWAKGKRKEALRRFDEFGGEFERQCKIVFPGVPPEAIMGFTLNGGVKENTTGFITGLEDERPPKRERPPLGGIAAQKFHELGMFGVEGGPREGPAPSKGSPWAEAADSADVKSLLGRAGNTKPGGWLSIPDQIAIGLTNTRSHGRSVIKHKSFPVQARPATEKSLWFVALSFMAWSAGDGRAAQHVSNFAKELAAVPEAQRWGAFIRLLADAGKKCKLKAGPVKHASPFYSAVRTLQKIEAGLLLATERGVDVSFFDDGLDTDRDDLHKTLTRLANEGNLDACKSAGVAAQALGGGKAKKELPAPTLDQIVTELDGKLSTTYGTYDGYTKSAVKSGSILGRGIGNGVHPDFLKKLQQGEKAAAALIHPNGASVTAQEWAVKSISGLASRAGSKGWHPWGLAVDIDYYENPYIMHTAGESSLDKLLGPVYHRIARLMLERDSVIPDDITKPRKKGETAAARTERLYDALNEESQAMRNYFALMLDQQKLDQRLKAVGSDSRTRVLADATPQDAAGLQKLMLLDYVTLSGREGPAVGSLSYPDPVIVHGKDTRGNSKAGEAPFFVGKGKDQKVYQSLIARRAPENGFLTIRKEIVVGLSGAGLRWGAIDFGGSSGDVMHFDDGYGKLAGQIVAARKDAQQKLTSAAQSYGLGFVVEEEEEEDEDGLTLAMPLSRPSLTAKDARFAPDNLSPDYRHLGASGVSQAFDFTSDLLERLCQLNSFNPNLSDDEKDEREVIFALRGCAIVGATASGDATSAFVSTLSLTEDLPDHKTSHCVIGVWKRAAKQLAAFAGSTVPYWGSMEKFRQGGPASNMLLTGRHLYTVGTHRANSNLEIRGALLQQGPVVVVRTLDDLMYETTDTFEVGSVGDNIHPSRFAKPTDRYSSQGCLTVSGAYDLKSEKYSGLWSRFRGALGLDPASPKNNEDGRRFVCVLLTGREARLISQNASAPLKRIRFGSRSADVTALQNALTTSGHFKGKVNGQMGPSTTIAYINWQREQNPGNPSADGIKKP